MCKFSKDVKQFAPKCVGMNRPEVNVTEVISRTMSFNPPVEVYFAHVCVEGGGVKLYPRSLLSGT